MLRVESFYISAILLLFANTLSVSAQTDTSEYWHGIERKIRYQPDGNDFVIRNGERRFNRALYGTNTGFRVEAGDLPQFALYMPGMGGTLKFGLLGQTNKWLIDCDHIEARYRPGKMLYKVEDAYLGKGVLNIEVIPFSNAEGIIVKINLSNTQKKIDLFCGYGGATGKRFHRDGDIGADPESSFYLKPEYCADNVYRISENRFDLLYGSGKELSEAERYEIEHIPGSIEKNKLDASQKILKGTFPKEINLSIGNAYEQNNPKTSLMSKAKDRPQLTGQLELPPNSPVYFAIYNGDDLSELDYDQLKDEFTKSDSARESMVDRIMFHCPDSFITPVGDALVMASDAIYEQPTYLHGAVAWRMRLNGWRGAYTADPLGWHDRARSHFLAYSESQLTTPPTGPLMPDTSLNFARHTEELSTALFSEGYICRNPNGSFKAHHYDMNLVFIDQILRHLRWTGDVDFASNIWPVIKRHLQWEKRNFDVDDDGLYDSYCSIWASDALEYMGGGVTHSSAYNYLANKLAAEIALILNEDPTPYRNEALKIRNKINEVLWLDEKGHYAEFIDLLGEQQLHPSAGIWSIYHAIDSEVPDRFKAVQCTRYIDNNIPHIPVKAIGAPDNLFVLSTTSWMPYTWSVNNVALAEVLHTALAYWQAGRSEKAFQLWKSALIESMYLGASPGCFHQLSHYDAFRGELYRDFADPVGMASRTLVEGLFGIKPDLLNDSLIIQPGFPKEWDSAGLKLPHIQFKFIRKGNSDHYRIRQKLGKKLPIVMRVPVRTDQVQSITINNSNVTWKMCESLTDAYIEFVSPPDEQYNIQIKWMGNTLQLPVYMDRTIVGEQFVVNSSDAVILEVLDPQKSLSDLELDKFKLSGKTKNTPGNYTLFLKLQQGLMTWWQPVYINTVPHLKLKTLKARDTDGISLNIMSSKNPDSKANVRFSQNNQKAGKSVSIGDESPVKIEPKNLQLFPGSNEFTVTYKNKTSVFTGTNWNLKLPVNTDQTCIDLSEYYNADIKTIFEPIYFSPRPKSPTVQIPLQGVGNWCYPLVKPEIDDSGLRQKLNKDNIFATPSGIVFKSASPEENKNIAFTSQWDNFPNTITIPITGKAEHAYFLMSGTTNHMQSQFDNGYLEVLYTDGSVKELPLRNPDNWWPIEQDYYFDGYAFASEAIPPPRLHLKTGKIEMNFEDYISIKGYSNRIIDGGAASILDIPLDENKELKEIRLRSTANEVVIGVMAITLVTTEN